MTATISGDGTSTLINLTTSGNTVLGDASTDTLNVGNGGLVKDASGNVGIGTSSPSSALYVKRTAGNAGIYADYNGTNIGRLEASSNGNLYIGLTTGSGTISLGNTANANAVFLDSSGNLLVGTTSGSNHVVLKDSAVGSVILGITNTGQNTAMFYGTDAAGNSTSNTGFIIRKVNATGRSINAAGTINASGADYAEYMTKAGDFVIAKGDVVGINSQGKLTNVFADAVSFMVKSTDPSYVGGDTWGSEDKIGKRPTLDAPQEEQDAFESALEAARQKVDRIAFAGQVPVNVLGATAGQYIIPVNNNGAIKGEAVSNPTFEQYQTAVGKVIAIESDGRAKIIVKVA